MVDKMVLQENQQVPRNRQVVDPDHPTVRQHLPVQFTSFIGRERETTEVKELLASSRLVTLTGTGGCGKTRLGLHVASDLEDAYPDGVCWVDLAPLADPNLLPQAIAKAINAGEPTGRPLLDYILDLLPSKNMLLVLDNCEHLALACAEFAHDVLCDAPHVRILATSREPLAVMGEMLYPVLPLALPPKSQLTDIGRYDSIRLFVERAQAVLPTFRLTSANTLRIADICRRLDGIPLAIELASVRINTLSIEQIAERLDDRFSVLSTKQHGVPSHHRTLRAALDWSYSTLSIHEQALLRALSVFAGSCSLEAIIEVCSGVVIASDQIVDSLSSLVNKSLVLAETLGTGAARYWMLETIRQYARDRLLETSEDIAARNQHLDYFIKLAEEIEPRLHGPDQDEWLERLEYDHENFRAALDWSLNEGRVEKGLRLAADLMWYWEMRTYWSEARQYAKVLLSRPEAAPRTLARAKALLVIITMGGFGGINKQERPYAEELIAIAREHGATGHRVLAYGLAQLSHMVFYDDPRYAISLVDEGLASAYSVIDEWLIAYLLMLRGWYLRSAKDYPSALNALDDSLKRFRTLGDKHWSGIVSGSISIIHFEQGDLGKARQEFEQLLQVYRGKRDRRAIATVLMYLGEIEHTNGRYDTAKRYYSEYLEIAREIGDKMHTANGTYALGFMSLHEHDLDSARLHFAETVTLGREIGMKYMEWAIFGFACLASMDKKALQAIRLFAFTDYLQRDKTASQAEKIAYQYYLPLAREQVDEAGFNTAWSEGCMLSIEQAIAEALQETLAVQPASGPQTSRDVSSLTPRELEVLRLVAEGLSDAQVATNLVISRRTVSTHLTAIYGKLGVTSRSAATRYALDNHLI